MRVKAWWRAEGWEKVGREEKVGRSGRKRRRKKIKDEVEQNLGAAAWVERYNPGRTSGQTGFDSLGVVDGRGQSASSWTVWGMAEILL